MDDWFFYGYCKCPLPSAWTFVNRHDPKHALGHTDARSRPSLVLVRLRTLFVVHAFIRDASKSGMALRRKLGRAPTYDELAAHMGVNVARVRGLSNFKDVFSLDASPFGGAGTSRLNGRRSGVDGVGSSRGSGGSGAQSGSGYQHERLASSGVSPEKKAEVCLFRNRLEDLMSNLLSPDERRVVSMRYGLGGSAPTTISELAQKVGASKYIMRKTETRALNKLRRPELSRMDKLGS